MLDVWRHFFERPGVEQAFDAFAGGELPSGVLRVDTLLAAAQAERGPLGLDGDVGRPLRRVAEHPRRGARQEHDRPVGHRIRQRSGPAQVEPDRAAGERPRRRVRHREADPVLDGAGDAQDLQRAGEVEQQRARRQDHEDRDVPGRPAHAATGRSGPASA